MTNDTDEEKDIERQILAAEAAGTSIGEIADAERELDAEDARAHDDRICKALINWIAGD